MNRYLSAIFLYMLLATGPARGQSGSDIQGTVLDDDGQPVRNAIVTLLPPALRDTTGADGVFRFKALPEGEYTLTAAQPWLGVKDTRLKLSLPSDAARPIVVMLSGRTYETDEVVVVAAAPESPRSTERETPGGVSVVEREEFEDRAATVAEVIAATPGATVRTLGGLGDYTEVSLRGSNGQQVQVYLDGMLLNEAVGGAVDLASIPLAQAQSVEVWRSGAPSRFGGSAVGGAINIRTRDFLGTGGTASIGYGSHNTVQAQGLRLLSPGSSRLLLTAGYSASDNDFRFRSNNGTVYNTTDDFWADRRNDGFRSVNLLGKYRVILGPSALLELSEHLVSSDKELPGADIVQKSLASISTVRNLVQARLAISPFLGEFLEAEPTVHHILTREHYRDRSGSVGWGVQDNVYRSDALRFAFPFTAKTGRGFTVTLTPGADREWYRPEHHLQQTIPLSCDRERYSAALDGVLRLFRERLTLTASLSRERYFSSFEGQPSPQNRVTPKPKRHLLTNAHGGLKLSLGRGLALAANYGDVVRIPGFSELFGDRGITVSNPDLRPERTFRWDAGLRGAFAIGPAALSLEGAFFRSRNRNLIQWYANDAGFLYPDNVAASYVRGAEFSGSLRLPETLSLSGNWTIQESKVTAEKNRIYRGRQLPNRPGHYGGVRLELPFRRATPFWSLDHKGAYYLDRANQRHQRYPGRTIQDMGVMVPLPGKLPRITVESRNIQNVHTFDTRGMPLPGRTLFCTLTWGEKGE